MKGIFLERLRQPLLSGFSPLVKGPVADPVSPPGTSAGKAPKRPITTAANLRENVFEGIPFEVVQRRVKYARVEFKPYMLRVIAPRGVSALNVLRANREKIIAKYKKLQRQLEEAYALPLLERDSKTFEAMVLRFLQEYAVRLNVSWREVRFRKMWRRWGTCRSNGVITINSGLRQTPERLVAYIVYHELAHFLVRGHDRRFKNIIVLEFPDYRQLDRQLNLYGLRLLTPSEKKG